MKAICQEQAEQFSLQAERARQEGNLALADRLQKKADNYQILDGKVADAQISSDEAINYRLNPRWETVKDLAEVSHQAGIEGARLGAAFGGSISLITNLYAVAAGSKEFSDAVWDISKTTLGSAGVGYMTAATGSALTSYLGQSSSQATRQLAKSNLPGMVVTTCMSMGRSVKRFAQGEIDTPQLLEEMESVGVGMVSGSFFTVVGQIALPIPIVGGVVGGLIGSALFNTINSVNITTEEYCAGINRFAAVLGKELPIRNMEELDAVMLSDEPLVF